MFEALLSDPWAPHPVANRHICSFGSQAGPTETRTQETKLPEWVDTASQQNYYKAKQVAEGLQGPYQGNRVAGLTPGQLSNIDAAQANVGSTGNAYGVAQDTTRNFLNYQAPQVSAGQLSQTDLNPYMNPFTSQVTNYGLQQLEMQRQQALNQTGNQAINARAFGGSRQGVQEGITNAASAMSAGKLASDLQSQNFLQAQNAANTDIGRRYQADLANQTAAQQSANTNLAASNQLASQAQAGQQSFLQGLGASQGQQALMQGQTQAEIDAQRALYGEQTQYPIQQLQILQGALSNSPYGNTVIGTQPGPSSNPGMQLLGMGMQAASIAAMSDRREKTDIRKIGTDDPTGLPVYSYRYRGDPKSYPKLVGPMAQDVAAKYPEQVVPVGNRLAVRSNFLAGVMGRASDVE